MQASPGPRGRFRFLQSEKFVKGMMASGGATQERELIDLVRRRYDPSMKPQHHRRHKSHLRPLQEAPSISLADAYIHVLDQGHSFVRGGDELLATEALPESELHESRMDSRIDRLPALAV